MDNTLLSALIGLMVTSVVTFIWPELFRKLYTTILGFVHSVGRLILLTIHLRIARYVNEEKRKRIKSDLEALEEGDSLRAERKLKLVEEKLRLLNEKILRNTTRRFFAPSFGRALHDYLRYSILSAEKKQNAQDKSIIYDQMKNITEENLDHETRMLLSNSPFYVQILKHYATAEQKISSELVDKERRKKEIQNYIESYNDILTIAEQKNYPSNYRALGKGYLNLGSYSSLIDGSKENYYKTAITYYHSAVQICNLDIANRKKELSKSAFELGKAYYELSQLVNEEDNLKLSMESLLNAHQNAEDDNDLRVRINQYLGKCHSREYRLNGNVTYLHAAMKYFNSVIEYYLPKGEKFELANAYRQIANVHWKLSEQEERYQNINESLSYFDLSEKYLEELRNREGNSEAYIQRCSDKLALTRFKYARSLIEKSMLDQSKVTLERAEKLLNVAYEFYTSSYDQEYMAKVEKELIGIYTRLAEFKKCGEMIGQAIKQYARCTERMKDVLPIICLDAKQETSIAYLTLADSRLSDMYADVAIKYLDETMKGYSEHKHDYMALKSKLYMAEAYIFKSQISEPIENLTQAENVIKEVLHEYSALQITMPYLYAKSYSYLARVYTGRLQYAFVKEDYWRGAIENFHRAYMQLSFEKYPLEYARIKMYEGDCHLYRKEIADCNSFQESLKCYGEAECIMKEESNELYLAKIYMRLGLAYGLESACFNEAKESFDKAEMYFTQEKFPIKNGKLMFYKAKVYYSEYLKSRNELVLPEALKHCRYALDEIDIRFYPLLYAWIARLYAEILEHADKKKHVDETIALYERAMAINVLQEHPQAETQISQSDDLNPRIYQHARLAEKLENAYLRKYHTLRLTNEHRIRLRPRSVIDWGGTNGHLPHPCKIQMSPSSFPEDCTAVSDDVQESRKQKAAIRRRKSGGRHHETLFQER